MLPALKCSQTQVRRAAPCMVPAHGARHPLLASPWQRVWWLQSAPVTSRNIQALTATQGHHQALGGHEVAHSHLFSPRHKVGTRPFEVYPMRHHAACPVVTIPCCKRNLGGLLSSPRVKLTPWLTLPIIVPFSGHRNMPSPQAETACACGVQGILQCHLPRSLDWDWS